MYPQQPQAPQTQLRRFTDLLDALKHEYEAALSAAPTPAPSDPQYLNELALIQRTVKELEQSHLKAKAGYEEEVSRLVAVCRQHGIEVPGVGAPAAVNPPNLENDLTAGVLTSTFGGRPTTPPVPPQTTHQAQQGQQKHGWMAIYSLPEQERAIAVDLLHTLPTDHVVCSVSFSPEGLHLAIGTNRAVIVFESGTGKRVATLTDHSTDSTTTGDLFMRSVQWSEDATLVAAGGEDHFVRVWVFATQRLKHRLAGHSQDIYAVAFMPGNKTLVSASGDRTIRLWEVASGECKSVLGLGEVAGRELGFTSVAVTDRLIIAGCLDKTVRIWSNSAPSLLDHQLVNTLEGHQDAVYSVALSSDHSMLASCSLDRSVRIWRRSDSSFTLLDTLQNHKDFCLSVSWSPDGSLLASASKDRSLLLYNVHDSKATLQCSIQGHRNSVITCQFSGSGNELILASGSGDCRTRIWRIDRLH